MKDMSYRNPKSHRGINGNGSNASGGGKGPGATSGRGNDNGHKAPSTGGSKKSGKKGY